MGWWTPAVIEVDASRRRLGAAGAKPLLVRAALYRGVVVDVLVAGAGPAGWAVAGACSRLGLRTALVAPRPTAPWPATYGMWADEVAVLPRGTRYVTARPRVVAGTSRWLPRDYAVLDNESLRAGLAHPDLEVREGRVEDPADAAVVIDATGARGAGGGAAEQSAFGVVVPAEVAAPVVAPGEAVFMDWRQPAGGPATFLYAIPLPDGRVLLEETSLADRPGLSATELRTRLLTRLTHHGIDPAGSPTDRVRFPLNQPPDLRKLRRPRTTPAPTRTRGAAPSPVYRWGWGEPGGDRGLWTTRGREWRSRLIAGGVSCADGRQSPVVPFGAAAGLIHPATGYSVADSLRLAPLVAAAIRAAGPGRAREAALRVMWSPAARAVHRLRRAGLATLLALPPGATAEFFELFFGLPPHLQRAFLSERDNLAGTVAAMATMFRRAPWPLRRAMAVHHYR